MKIYAVSDTVKKGGGGRKSSTAARKRRRSSKPKPDHDELYSDIPF